MFSNQTVEQLSPSFRHVSFVYSLFLVILGSYGNGMLLLTLHYRAGGIKLQSRSISTSQALQYSGDSTLLLMQPSRKIGRLSLGDYSLYVLTVCETSCLILIVLRYLVSLGFSIDIRASSTFSCVLFSYTTSVLTNLYIAMLCIFSAQRTLSMGWPLLNRKWMTKFRLNSCLLLALLLILVKQAPTFWIARLIKVNTDNDQYLCEVEWDGGQWRAQLKQVYSVVELISTCVIGYPLLVVINIVLCVFMQRRIGQAKLVYKQTYTRNNNVKLGNRTVCPRPEGTCAARVLLILSIFHVIATIPYFVIIHFGRKLDLGELLNRYRLEVYYVCALLGSTHSAVSYFLVTMISIVFKKQSHATLLHLFKCQSKAPGTKQVSQ